MASGSINIPDTGSPAWKDPVANLAALPASGNSTGDARVAEDTQVIYIWSGSAWNATGGGSGVTALTGDITGTGPGTTATTIANLAVTNAKIANATIDLTTKVTGVLPAANGGAGPATLVLYADVGRVDTYTADGSIGRPFKTIQAALNAMGSHSNVTINIMTGTYVENLVINNAAVNTLTLMGEGAVLIQPASGNALSCTANNDNLSGFMIWNIIFEAPIVLTGASNGTNFGFDFILFRDCLIEADITSTNTGGILVQDTLFDANVTLINNATSIFFGGPFVDGGTATLISQGGNTPNGYTGTALVVEVTVASFSAVNVDAGSTLFVRAGASIGFSGSTMTINGTLVSYPSTIRADVTLANGSTWTDRGATFLGTITNNGATITHEGLTTLSRLNTGTLGIMSGANTKFGTANLGAGGTVTVSNTSVTANSEIFVTSQVDGGTVGFLRVKNKVASTGFDIVSSNASDTSTVAWMIVEKT